MDEDSRERARVWRTLSAAPPTFVPSVPGTAAVVDPPTDLQLRRRHELSPRVRPERLRGEWMISLAGLGYHMSINSDRLMWSAEFGETERVESIVTPRCSSKAKRRAMLGLVCSVTVTLLLFFGVIQLDPNNHKESSLSDIGAKSQGEDSPTFDTGSQPVSHDVVIPWTFTAMTFAAIMSAITSFGMLIVNAMAWMGEPGLTPDFYLGNDFVTAMHVAAAFGQTGVVNRLIDLGSNLQAVDLRLRTPLHYAAMHGRLDTCKLLIRRGASLSARDDEGLYPYELALRESSCDASDNLLEILGKRPDVLLEVMLDSCGEGANATLRWQDVRRIMQTNKVFLANSAACANARNITDFPVMSYVHGSAPLAILGGSYAVARVMSSSSEDADDIASMQWDLIARDLVRDYGAHVDALNPFNGHTALHEALSRSHNVSLAETFLDLGASGRRVALDSGKTPLHMAAASGFVSILRKIKSLENPQQNSERGWDAHHKANVDPAWVDMKDKNGSTPLHEAVSRFYIDCVRVLLEMGCDPSIPGGSGCAAVSSMYTPLGWAVVQKPGLPCDSDSESDSEDSMIHGATAFGITQREQKGTSEALVKILLGDPNVNPNLYTPGGLAPLHLACRAGRIESVRQLLNGGAQGRANPKLPCKRGRTALQYARANKAGSQAVKLVEMLVLAEQEELSRRTKMEGDMQSNSEGGTSTTIASDGIRRRRGLDG